MKIRTISFLILAVLFNASCEQVENIQKVADIPVIQAFLVPGKSPVIKITRIIPYSAEEGDTLATPIPDLEVFLMVRGVEYILPEDSSGSGSYQLAAGDNIVSPGDTIELHTNYKGTLVAATTVVPSALASLTMSTNILYYTSGNPSTWLSGGEIELTWDNPNEDYYYVTVQNMETDPTPLNDMALNMPRFGSSPPSTGNQFRIGMRNVTYFGTHQVIIYHVNHEFAELFDNPGMSSVTLTEPPTNISNGLGIFTAMNPDTLYFEVKKQ
jgi:hypothetical protein